MRVHRFLPVVPAVCCAVFLVACNGPEEVQQDEFTFTEDTLDQAHDLTQRAESGATSSGTLPYLEPLPTGSGAETEEEVILDLSQVATYQSIRTGVRSASRDQFTVTNEFLNVRKEPNTKSESLARLNFGDPISVDSFVDAQWAKVRLGSGTQGYVSQKYISRMVGDDMADAEKRLYEGQYFVSFGFVNMRKLPDQKSDKLGEIPGNAIVKPSEIKDGWAKVTWNGAEGYISSSYLKPFLPTIVVRQNSYELPVLLYRLSPGDEEAALQALQQHVAKLKGDGYTFITLADFRDLLLAQQKRDMRLPAKRIVVAVTGITKDNVKQVSDGLNAALIDATLFIETHNVGLSGITEKTLLTLVANGYDIQSATHTGDDLRALTNSQVSLELKQSRKLLEDLTHRSVFAVAYPQGGTNERLMDLATQAGYLIGLSSASDRNFSREELLSMPSVQVFTSMSADDVARLVQP